jgi:general stress protein 26
MIITNGKNVTLNSKALTFYSDPGHSWLRINKGHLMVLGIENKISSYSYMKDDNAYLEEDCDAPLIRQALLKKGFDSETLKQFFNSIKDITTNDYSAIRSYDSYK